MAESIRAARRLDPENLSERLPRTGAGDELDELAGTINGLLDRLAAYHAQIIRFTADASHELRGPLGAMRAAVEIALQKPRESEEYRNVLASLGEQCERLTSLVNGLLLLARADAGEVLIRREAVDLAALACEVGEMFDPLAEEKGIQLVTHTSSPVTVTGDPSRLRQLVTNLLDNAIRFTEPGGSVTLRVDGIRGSGDAPGEGYRSRYSRRYTCRISSSGSIRRMSPVPRAAAGSALASAGGSSRLTVGRSKPETGRSKEQNSRWFCR